jgi:hypothetical protein
MFKLTGRKENKSLLLRVENETNYTVADRKSLDEGPPLLPSYLPAEHPASNLKVLSHL